MLRDEIRIERDDLSRPAVHALLEEHLADMRATSPPESVHALDLDRLRRADITFWTAWADGALVGCGALRELDKGHGEIKSMRTAAPARGRGIASKILARLVAEACRRSYGRLSLETGTHDLFAPARRLYARHGFVVCAPFGDYVPDPNSMFMTRRLAASSGLPPELPAG